MTGQELNQFLECNKNIEWVENIDEEQFLFRNTDLAWYQNDPERATAVTYWKMKEMSAEDLMLEINRGLMVEGITRITGYFTKVRGWNPGKRGELKERRKFNV